MTKLACLLVILPSILSIPAMCQWQRIDTITAGDFDDSNAKLDRGGSAWYDSHPGVHWLIFERRRAERSEIVARRFFHASASWDSSEFLISSMSLPLSQINPEICTNSTRYSSADSSWMTYSVLAAWEVDSSGRKEVYYRFLDTDNSIRLLPTSLMPDSVTDESPRLFPWNDTTFVVIWRHGMALVYATVTLNGHSEPDTLAISNDKDLEFDLVSLSRRYEPDGEPMVWTSRADSSRRVIVAATLRIDSTIKLQGLDTLALDRDTFSPIIMDNGRWGVINFFFTAVDNGLPQTYSVVWNSYLSEFYTAPIFANDTQSNVWLRGWERTIFVDQWPLVNRVEKSSPVFPSGFVVWECVSNSDTIVILREDRNVAGTSLDTIDGPGYDRNPSFGTYSFQILDKACNMIIWESNRTGRSRIFSKIFVWSGTDAVNERRDLSRSFRLYQNYPSPFNPSTTISYQLPVVSHVVLEIYDTLGREVATLVDEKKSPGTYEAKFDGNRFASGVYFCRMTAGNYVSSKKIMLIK